MLQKLGFDSFSHHRWLATDILKVFNCYCRKDDLFRKRKLLQKYAIGYCDAECLRCRPKTKNKAVMFLKDNQFFWFHLRNEEFDLIFTNKGK